MGKKGLIPLNVSYYLDKYPIVGKYIEWKFDAKWLEYKDWSTQDKKILDTFYRNMLTGTFNLNFEPKLFDSPLDNDDVKNDLKKLYFSYVAHSIWLEMTESVPWHLHDYGDGHLYLLLSGKTFIQKNEIFPDQDFYRFTGTIVPSGPEMPYNFMKFNGFINFNRIDTIEAFLKWVQINVYHSSDKLYNDFRTSKSHNFPLKGFLYPVFDNRKEDDEPPFVVPTAYLGCHGAADSIRWVLKSVNIPSKFIKYYSKHGGIEFSSELIRLLHADDIYAKTEYYDTGINPVRRATVRFDNPDTGGGTFEGGPDNTGSPTGVLDTINFLGHKYISPLKLSIYDREYQLDYQSDFGKYENPTASYNRRQNLAAFSYPTLKVVRRVLEVYEHTHKNYLDLRESVLKTIKTEYKNKVTPVLSDAEINAIADIVYNHINDKLKPLGLDSYQALSKYPDYGKIYTVVVPPGS